MSDACGDNRFELIEKYKQKLIESTNIKDSKEEMAVIDNILFRFWQMGWLDKLDGYENLYNENIKIHKKLKKFIKVANKKEAYNATQAAAINRIRDEFGLPHIKS